MGASRREHDGSGEAPAVPRVRRAHAVLGLLLAALALYWVVSRIEIRTSLELLGGVRIAWFLLGCLAFYSSVPLRAWRWRILLANVGRTAPVATLSGAILRAWTVNCVIPGRSGDLYSAFVLKTEHGFGGSKTLGTIFASRVLDLLVLVALMTALFLGQLKSGHPPLFRTLAYAVLGLGSALLVGILVMDRLPRTSRWLPLPLAERYDRFKEAAFGSVRRTPQLVLLTVALWCLEAARLWCVLAALELPRPLFPVTFLALGAAVITTLPITPAGLGTVELYYQASLQTIGISPVAATSAALLDRMINYWFILLAGGLYLAVSHGIERRSRT